MLLAVLATVVSFSTFAANLQAELLRCAAMSDSLQRLVCYDGLARVGGGSTSASPTANEDSTRCAATTRKGTRCSRKAKPGTSYCWQHTR
jgi:hypothetical protein